MGWQTRQASGVCSFGDGGHTDAMAPQGARERGDKSFSVQFDVSAEGSIMCKDVSDTAVGTTQALEPGKRCAAIYPDVMQLVARRVDVLKHGAWGSAAQGGVSELQTLDNEHLPLGPRVAVLMTGELRTFRHTVRLP
jgi:hypothetical protein